MKLNPEQLDSHLSGGVANVYLVAGDEPLLVNEAADAIRGAAKNAGYTERELLVAERGFDWQRLGACGANLSLFGDRQLVELRLPTGKPGNEGSAAIVDFVSEPNPDVLLLVISGKLDRGGAGAKWVKTLEAAGVFVPVYPVDAGRLPGWIRARMTRSGLKPDREAVAVLADRVEGNLLAAKQEIDKLLLLNGPGPVDADAVTRAVADSARFDVFQLVDAVLEGNAARGMRMLEGIRAEGVEPPLVIWALARELRGLARMAFEMSGNRSAEAVMGAARVWSRRKPLVGAALRRHTVASLRDLLNDASRADRMAKGALQGDAWSELAVLVVRLARGAGAGRAA